jgi:hypothetical protein
MARIEISLQINALQERCFDLARSIEARREQRFERSPQVYFLPYGADISIGSLSFCARACYGPKC